MKTYLIHIQLQMRPQSEQADFGRAMNHILESHGAAHHVIYTAKNTEMLFYDYLVTSEKPASFLRKVIDGNHSGEPGNKPYLTRTGFKNGDSLFVVEIGSDISENGYNVMAAWLNRQNRNRHS